MCPTPLAAAGGGHESADVVAQLEWKDARPRHHETQTHVDGKADLLSHNSRLYQHDESHLQSP